VPYIDIDVNFSHPDLDEAANSTRRREYTLYICGRFYFAQTMYALAGASGRAINAKILAPGQENAVTLGSFGIPVGIGFELGRTQHASLTANAEFGFALFFGPAGNDFTREIRSPSKHVTSTFNGSSGILIGIGINYYI